MSETTKKNWLSRNWIPILSTIVLIACAVYVYHIYAYWKDNAAEAGQFGDMFGAITAVIGSLTFIFLIYSINLQRQELELARDEYKLGLAEMKEQNATSKLLQETTRIQRIETTFFNLIQLYQNKEIFSIEEERVNIHHSGFGERDQNEFENLRKIKGKDYRTYYMYNDENDQFLVDRYNKRTKIPNAERFYPLVMNIITFLKESDLTHANKQVLMNTFLSLLSQQELLILFYYMRFNRDYNSKYVNQEVFDFAQQVKLFHNLDLAQFPHNSYNDLFRMIRRN